MTPFQHRIILPPILVAIHCILLLPLFLPISRNNYDLPLKGLPLHLQYSIPSGVIGFVVVMIAKHLAVKIPLPKDPRKKRLAEGLEWTVLFLVGFLEEVWRWGVVRVLVNLEGGDGGYGNTSRGIVVDSGIVRPIWEVNIWEGVYFMGWIWCCIESVVAWISYGPHSEEGRLPAHNQHHHLNHGSRHRNEGSPSASPRASYFPHSRGNHMVSPSTNTADNSNPFLHPFRTSSIWDGPDTRQTLTKTGLSFRDPPRVEIHPSSAELSGTRPTFGSQCTFGAKNGFGFQNGVAESPQSPITGTYNRDLEITQRQTMNHYNDEYGDDEEEDDIYSSQSESETSSIRSSSETVRSRSATPLLSSSLPYDPNSEHPHQAFEQQSLLQSQYRRMSYNTLAEPVPIPSNFNSDDDDGDYDEENALEAGLTPRQYQRGHRNGGDIARVSPPRPRAYPSFPSYSASYNHTYFSASPASRSRPLNLNLSGSPRSPSGPANDGCSPPHQVHEQHQQPQMQPQRGTRPTRLPLHHYLRMIYGVDTNSLNIWLPILWRTAALFRGLGHVLLFAWFPCLVYKGQFQIWTCLMVTFIAVQKGWYTVEWVGGTVARNGVIKASIFTTVLSLVVYLVGLKLWEILP